MSEVDKRLTDWNNLQTSFEILVLETLGMYKYTHTDVDASSLARALMAATMLQIVSLGNDKIKVKVENTISDNEEVAEFINIIYERFTRLLGKTALDSVDLGELTPIELFGEMSSSRLLDTLRTWKNNHE